MTDRIQKIIASRGVASRRKAEEMILAGRVSCNGVICTLGQSADPDMDEILIDGQKLPEVAKHVYIMLHKPRGFVTTLSDEKGRINAAQLIDCGQRVYPVGRLDMDSEGLLLFTNDGEFANLLMHPRHNVDKVYKVYVTGFSQQAAVRLLQPMELDGYLLRKTEVTVLQNRADGSAVLTITIHEGRNRQVRRMCAIAGMQVQRLIRIAEGSLQLGALPKGKWRYLTDREVSRLRK